jgi:hypothetical protein
VFSSTERETESVLFSGRTALLIGVWRVVQIHRRTMAKRDELVTWGLDAGDICFPCGRMRLCLGFCWVQWTDSTVPPCQFNCMQNAFVFRRYGEDCFRRENWHVMPLTWHVQRSSGVHGNQSMLPSLCSMWPSPHCDLCLSHGSDYVGVLINVLLFLFPIFLFAAQPK